MACDLIIPDAPVCLAQADIDPATLRDPAPSPEALCRTRETAAFIRLALSGLTARHISLLTLRYAHGLTLTAAAEALGIKRNTASDMERRALSRLRASLSLMGITAAGQLLV